ncbi:PAS domain-containing protein [Natronococcus sp. JC468]|uniref:PAS domain-containing protein n=1 Tax=Natronococcus sp. JC468 TaxID=1961921 RepID=UPI001AE02251
MVVPPTSVRIDDAGSSEDGPRRFARAKPEGSDVTVRSIPFVDRIADGVFALDERLRVTYLNDEAAALFGADRGDVLGKRVDEAVPDTLEDQFPAAFYRAADGGLPATVELYHHERDARFELRAYPVEDGLSAFVLELDDRERRVDRRAAVLEAIDDGVVTIDGNRRILGVNEAMTSFLGADRADLVGEGVDAIAALAGVADEDLEAIRRGIGDVESGLARQRRLELPVTDGDGSERVGELRLVPIRDGAASVAAVVRDVTDRREYERVVESLHEVTRWLLEADDPQEICAVAVHAGSDLLGLPISGVWLLEDERGYLEPVAGTAEAYDEFGGFPRFGPGEGLVWDAFEAGEVERFDDLRTVDDLYNPDTPLRSEVIAPIGTHGVLMTGSFEPEAFDETDVELLSTLVENTRAALDRTERERALRERTERIERQTERLEAIARLLSRDLECQLERVGTLLDEGDGDDRELPLAEREVESILERTDRLVDDVRELARDADAVGARSRLDLATAVEDARPAVGLEPDAVRLVGEATLRADRDRFRHLLESAFDAIAARTDDVAIEIGPLEDGSRGLFVRDAEAVAAADGRTEAVDGVREGTELAVLGAIARAHGWRPLVERNRRDRLRIAIREIATLERTESGSGSRPSAT